MAPATLTSKRKGKPFSGPGEKQPRDAVPPFTSYVLSHLLPLWLGGLAARSRELGSPFRVSRLSLSTPLFSPSGFANVQIPVLVIVTPDVYQGHSICRISMSSFKLKMLQGSTQFLLLITAVCHVTPAPPPHPL